MGLIFHIIVQYAFPPSLPPAAEDWNDNDDEQGVLLFGRLDQQRAAAERVFGAEYTLCYICISISIMYVCT